VKEIYGLVKEKYQYANELLYSKERNVYNIQFQTFYNVYNLNIKKRKVHIIPRRFIDLEELRKNIDLNIELFVINTSGEDKYNENDFQNLKIVLENKFNKPTPYEINDEKIIINNNINLISNYSNRLNVNNIQDLFKMNNTNSYLKNIGTNISNKNKSKNISNNNYAINSNLNQSIKKYGSKNNKKKLKVDYLEKTMALTSSKKYEINKNNNFIPILILTTIIIFIIIIILLILKLYKGKFSKSSNYSSINNEESEKISKSNEIDI